MRVLIFTAKYGNGHMVVANELKNYFESRGDEVFVRNPHMEYNKPVTTLAEKMYANVFSKRANNKYLKGIYGLSFEMFGNRHTSIFSRYGRREMTKIIKQTNPDLVIMTFPFQNKKFDVPVISVITDYGFSKIWYSKNIDHYIVGCDEVKEELLKYTDVDNVHVAGIPVNYRFSQVNNQTHVRRVVINLGALGGSEKEQIVKLITSLHLLDLTVEVVCGRNRKMYNYLNRLYGGINKILIHSYVNNMYEIYQRCDLIVSKAGGITIAEAISCELPLVINDTISLSGQEAMNIDFINEYEIGRCCSEDEIIKNIRYYLDNPEKYQESIMNMRKIKQTYEKTYDTTSLDIVRDLVRKNDKEE